MPRNTQSAVVRDIRAHKAIGRSVNTVQRDATRDAEAARKLTERFLAAENFHAYI